MGKFVIRRYQMELPDHVDKPSSPVKVVMIGDLHDKVFGKENHDLVDKIVEEHPDLIFSVGDLSVIKNKKKSHPEIGISLLKELSRECPAYASFGNHECRAKVDPALYPGIYEKLKRGMDLPQIHLLEDQHEIIEVKGTKLSIYGYELPMEYYAKFTKKKLSTSQMESQIGRREGDTFTILLAHNPHFFDSYAKWGADITFAGHAHGGIIRLPFIGGVISPQGTLFPRQICGLYDQGGRKLCVTAGLGTHSFMPRINNPAEITVVEFV